MVKVKKDPDPEYEYKDKLCDAVALYFKNPTRLLNATGRAHERLAAASLYDNGYTLVQLRMIFLWAQKDDYWNWISSVSALAAALLKPKNFANSMEAKYDAWVKTNPPRCQHGKVLDPEAKDTCPACLADPNCSFCRNGTHDKKGNSIQAPSGFVVHNVHLPHIMRNYQSSEQFICDCVASKIGLPSVSERILAKEKESLEICKTRFTEETLENAEE